MPRRLKMCQRISACPTTTGSVSLEGSTASNNRTRYWLLALRYWVRQGVGNDDNESSMIYSGKLYGDHICLVVMSFYCDWIYDQPSKTRRRIRSTTLIIWCWYIAFCFPNAGGPTNTRVAPPPGEESGVLVLQNIPFARQVSKSSSTRLSMVKRCRVFLQTSCIYSHTRRSGRSLVHFCLHSSTSLHHASARP